MEKGNFWDKIPSFIAGGTAILLFFSFVYNVLYFKMLDIRVGLVPLSIVDYSLAVSNYIFLLLPALIGFFINTNASELLSTKNSDRSKISKIDFTFIAIFILLLVLLLGSSLLHLFEAKSKNIYILEPLLLVPLGIGFIGLLIFRFPLLRTNPFIPILLALICVLILNVAHEVKLDILSSYSQNKNYLNDNTSQILIRTFEKGHLVSDKDYNLSFHYLGSDIVINFSRNEELAEYFEKYHNKEKEKLPEQEKELPNKK